MGRNSAQQRRKVYLEVSHAYVEQENNYWISTVNCGKSFVADTSTCECNG